LNPQQHIRVKELFTELCELSVDQQKQRLEKIQRDDPEVAGELKSLLSYHTQQSIIADTPPPRIRTRSTLSTTFQSRPAFWLRLGLRALGLVLPMLLIGWYFSHRASQGIRNQLRTSVSNRLNETVDQRYRRIRQWEGERLQEAVTWARDAEIVSQVAQLVKASKEIAADNEDQIKSLLQANASPSEKIQRQLNLLAGTSVKFTLWDRRMIVLADWNQRQQPEGLGSLVTPLGASMLAKSLDGQAGLHMIRVGKSILDKKVDSEGSSQLYIIVPVLDSTDSVMAVLMLHDYGLETSLETLLDSWNSQNIDETYIIGERGSMLTASRYGPALEELDLPRVSFGDISVPLVRDPGACLLDGKRTAVASSSWPPTFMAQQVTSGNNGSSVDGYRNYVGKTVVGAWRWLPEYEVGLAVEVHEEDAFAIASSTESAIGWLTALFSCCLAGLAGYWIFRDRRSRLGEISNAGPYQLQQLLGEGGMGRVYLAEHALLCRQSAVKILSGDVDKATIARFEREVQLASQLTHPNTIAIYDFGRNKEGLFFYAMEYIHGAHLGQLLEYAGPLHPGRCIYILRQLCRALGEAHSAGVVHRDIKPQNIMVCNRGGEPDFVKLFDYGLVKSFAPGISHSTSQTKIVVGTPRFMAPERLNSPWLADPRVDIYSVGALAYFLLTGKLPPLFTLSGPLSHEQPGIETLDLPKNVVEFGDLLGMCLSAEPSNRPSNMNSLLSELEDLAERFPWSREDSVVWWGNHEAKLLRTVTASREKLQRKRP
jgi:hypothetical protein